MGESHASADQRSDEITTIENLVYAKQSITRLTLDQNLSKVFTNNLAHLNGACEISTLAKSVIVN